MAYISSTSGIIDKTIEIVEPITTANGLEIYDIEFVKEGAQWYLRIYIDKETPIAISDCEVVSRGVEQLIDEADYIEKAYILEVSSPGINRKLKKEKDFIRYMEELIDVKLYKPRDNSKEFQGFLKSYNNGDVTIETENGDTLIFSQKEIAIVKLSIVW